MYKIIRILNKYIFSFLGSIILTFEGINIGDGLVLNGFPIITKEKGSSIIIGNNVVLTSKSMNTALGVNHPVIIRTLQEGARIVIGKDVGVSGASICAASTIKVGAKSLIGANVIITDTDFHSIISKGRRYQKNFGIIGSKEVIIGENVFIGANSIILKGVEIGDNSVIGAGSVVTKSIPKDVVAAGNPCNVINSIPDVL